MVGITAKSNKDELSSANNPMIKYMLKTRENHARTQKHDYSHVFRPKRSYEFLRLSAIAMAIEFAYAAETAFVSPILLQIGVDHKHMTMAWGLSPIIGFFLSPLLGSLSDRCKLSWGRRRPVISLLSLGILLGLILVPYGKQIGSWLGDEGHSYVGEFVSNYTDAEGAVAALVSDDANGSDARNFKYAIIFTIVGMVLLDLNADTCQTPARTYLLDMCIPEDQSKALTTFTLMAGVGGTIGYAIGGVDWEQTNIGSYLGGNVPTVFGLVTIIFIVCYIVTMTTFREIPLELIENDDLLKPLSAAAIRKEMNKNNNAIYYIKGTTSLELQMIEEPQMANFQAAESYQNGYSPNLSKAEEAPKSLNSDSEADDDDDKPVSLAQYLKSIFIMPYSMRMLAVTNLFCWMGHVTFCLYFTDFVGEAVFHGDPSAPMGSQAADLYEAGVRFGCWGMAIYAFSCSIYSLMASRLMQWLGIKVVYIAGILYYGVGMLILGLYPTKWGVLVFSTSAGVLYGTIFTIPFILVANYHSRNCFRVKNGESIPLKQKRGLGTDVAIISSMVFIAQLIVALVMGPLVAWMQTTSAILYASTVLSFVAAFCALFVLYV